MLPAAWIALALGGSFAAAAAGAFLPSALLAYRMLALPEPSEDELARMRERPRRDRPVTRTGLRADLGRTAVAAAFFGIAACSFAVDADWLLRAFVVATAFSVGRKLLWHSWGEVGRIVSVALAPSLAFGTAILLVRTPGSADRWVVSALIGIGGWELWTGWRRLSESSRRRG